MYVRIQLNGGYTMARPTTKKDLLEAAEHEYTVLLNDIDSLTDHQQHQSFEFEDRDKNVRDVLAHLYHWHTMMESWYQIGTVQGEMPLVPGEGYTWRTLPQMNLKIWEAYQDVTLEDIRQKLNGTHVMMLEHIKNHTNEELFSKGVYPWTKSSTLGAYFVSNTASHYVWAQKKIRKHRKLVKLT